MATSVRSRHLRSPRERLGTLPNVDLPPPAPDQAAEERMLRAALQDADETAFRAVFERLYPAMVRLASAHVRTRAEAEEVVHDAWLAAIRAVPRFEGRSSLKTWLFRILRNRARSVAERAARTIPFSALNAAGVAPEHVPAAPLWSRARASADPARALHAREVRRALEAALQELPPRQQEVVTLRDVEGWSGEEVCNALGISASNQRVLLHRARLRLRDALRPHAPELDCANAE